MTQTLEADVTYLYKIGGARQTIHPAGFAVRAATRRPARGRDRDLLFAAVVLHPRSPAASARPAPLETSAVESQAVELVDVAANTYYGVPGSVTSALRETGAAVNLALLQWNLRVARQAINAQGSLALVVLRNAELYLAQVGNASAVVARPDGLERFPTEVRGGRLLGISQTADLSFSLCTVSAGDFLVLGNEAWSDSALAGLSDLTLELAADRLAERSGPDAAGLIARFVPSGTVGAQGQSDGAAAAALGFLRSRLPQARSAAQGARPARRAAPVETPAPPRPARPAPPAEEVEPLPVEEPAGYAEPSEEEAYAPAEEEAAAPELQPYTRAPIEPPAPRPARRPLRLTAEADESLQTLARPTPAREGRTARRTTGPAPLAGAAAALQQGWQALARRVQDTLGTAVRGVLPAGVLPDNVRMPLSWMAVIAIALPLVVGLLVTSIYIQQGQAQQYSGFLEQAQIEVSLARTAPDTLAARPHWNLALDWLARAEAVRPGTAEVAVLRGEAHAAMDATELIARVNYRPLLANGFGPEANLTDVLVSGSEVYALDPRLGRVYRALRSEGGEYRLDELFNRCGSGPVGQHNVGPIVDMAWLTGPNPAGADSLIVMDVAGTLAFCPPDGSPPLATRLIPPDTGWTGPRALALYADGLYVLDPPGNQIWVFTRPGGQFSESPSRYFTTTSFDLSEAVDFTIANGEVFILFNDGRLLTCARGAGSQEVECVEAPEFTDGREGRSNGPRLEDLQTPFALLYDPPPEPSLYLADRSTAALYQVSLKLVFQRQFRPVEPVGAPISAVAIGSRKEMYVASGNNIYVGERP